MTYQAASAIGFIWLSVALINIGYYWIIMRPLIENAIKTEGDITIPTGLPGIALLLAATITIIICL